MNEEEHIGGFEERKEREKCNYIKLKNNSDVYIPDLGY